MTNRYYIGWDVGAWNCDRNRSQDAIVILDSKLNPAGKAWRGNLRVDINSATSTNDWLRILFQRCEAPVPDATAVITMAIDTPLGFSTEFVDLITSGKYAAKLESHKTNPYLFRYTERYLFQNGSTPLSAVTHMIGSQATKGMHVLAKFAPTIESCGVWRDGTAFHAIEAYPSACRNSVQIRNMLYGCKSLENDDLNDARICALVAYLFATNRRSLVQPPKDVPEKEGWIWVPK